MLQLGYDIDTYMMSLSLDYLNICMASLLYLHVLFQAIIDILYQMGLSATTAVIIMITFIAIILLSICNYEDCISARGVTCSSWNIMGAVEITSFSTYSLILLFILLLLEIISYHLICQRLIRHELSHYEYIIK